MHGPAGLPAAAGDQGQGDRDDGTERDADAPGSYDERMIHVFMGSGSARLGPQGIPAGDPEAIPWDGV
jgi:hypothetical protein